MADGSIEAERVESPLEDLHRAAGAMVLVRWCAAPWVLLQVLAYEIPYPPGIKQLALALVGVLVTGNAALFQSHRSSSGRERARSIALAGLILDVFLLSAYTWLFAFDYETQVWAILFIAPLEGAILFQLPGALSAWVVIVIGYAGRDIWASEHYGNPLLWNSISFRMGVGGIIALVAGLMARDLFRQRSQLTTALAEVQRVDRLRSGLVSMLGHDVRSPLTVIRGVVATLLMKGDLVSEEDRKTLLASADRQARRLESLANDLLDLARLERGRLELDTASADIKRLIESALSYVDGADDVQVDVDDDLRVMADTPRLEQVVINLVTNALRHGEPPYSITARREGDAVRIEFTDHGKGVPPEEVAGLFEPFRTEGRSGSVGYGLAIVKALTEAHGGGVSYVPSPTGGSRFVVTLPAG